MVMGVPLMCMAMYWRPSFPTSGSIPLSSAPALISLTIIGPMVSYALRMVPLLYVSMESLASGKAFRIERRAGSRRFHSSLSLIRPAPGRVLAAPMSMISAPSRSIWAALSATPSAVVREPGKKESSLTLIMPRTVIILQCRRRPRGRRSCTFRGRRPLRSLCWL